MNRTAQSYLLLLLGFGGGIAAALLLNGQRAALLQPLRWPLAAVASAALLAQGLWSIACYGLVWRSSRGLPSMWEPAAEASRPR